MKAAALTLVASVLAGGNDGARLDHGSADGLRPGDRGLVYYEISVRGSRQRIDVGSGTLIATDERESTLGPLTEGPVRPGYKVEFRVPLERLPDPALLELFRRRIEGQSSAQTVEIVLSLIAADRAVAQGVARRLEEGGLGSAPPSEPPSMPGPPTSTVPAAAARSEPPTPLRRPPAVPAGARIPAGVYEIGVEIEDADYYNQTPRFSLPLATFTIDRSPVTRVEFAELDPAFVFSAPPITEFATGVTYSQAQRFCQARQQRLPTEFEWEVAHARSQLTEPAPIYEWTSSWYEAYPGNLHNEADYGRRLRVLRGALDPAELDIHRRFFMAPADSDRRVGFRCAASSTGAGR